MLQNSKQSKNFSERRAFMQGGAMLLLGAGANWSASSKLWADEGTERSSVRVGMATDLHYADKAPAGSRHYRESLAKLAEATNYFQQTKPAFIVELGDFIDAAESVATEQSYLKTVSRAFAAAPGEKHYVLGNHCVYTLTKEEFLGGVGREKSYYAFDQGGLHFIILDSCFRSDGAPYGRKNFQWTDPNIPAAELDWLQSDLQANNRPTVVFAHQRLDVSNHYGVKNAADVRRVLEASGQVSAVFQGHSHQNDYREINGVHYCTLAAMVEGSGLENNAYTLMDVFRDGSLRLAGNRKQKSYHWK